MNNKLKVGQSFDVVEVLSTQYYIDAFNIGDHTFKYKGEYICTSNSYREDYVELGILNCFNRLNLRPSSVKPIGKLTITKLK